MTVNSVRKWPDDFPGDDIAAQRSDGVVTWYGPNLRQKIVEGREVDYIARGLQNADTAHNYPRGQDHVPFPEQLEGAIREIHAAPGDPVELLTDIERLYDNRDPNYLSWRPLIRQAHSIINNYPDLTDLAIPITKGPLAAIQKPILDMVDGIFHLGIRTDPDKTEEKTNLFYQATEQIAKHFGIS